MVNRRYHKSFYFRRNEKFITLIIFIILVIYGTIAEISAANPAYVTIDFDKKSRVNVSPYLFGGFIEYYQCFANGPKSLYAQELNNRGFDIGDTLTNYCQHWFNWSGQHSIGAEWKILSGGYNPNGLLFLRITKPDSVGYSGIYQKVFTTKGQGYDVYAYVRGDSSITDVSIKIMNKHNSTLLFSYSFGKPSGKWEKKECKVPKLDDYNEVNVLICFTGKGALDIDETSFMPDENYYGVRKNQYEMYKEWSPTILRYPGGWFVEYSGYKWQMSIGELDQRSIYKGYENVRMDFGLDEFLRFCQSLNIEPHITISFLNSTPEDAANLVEYCNGDTNTVFGSLRAKNGHYQPYNVKIWEIGNEIWENPINYANGFIKFYDSMKRKDPTISCIISADIWQWKPFFDTLMTIIGEKCDIYGWHWTQPHKNLEPATSEEIYKVVVGGNLYTEFSLDSVDKWIGKLGLKNNLTQAITEVWATYDPNVYEWSYDTVARAGSLENGLWMASQIMSCIKKSDKLSILEKTIAVTTYRTEINIHEGIRESYKTPSLLACIMARNHYGTERLQTSVKSEKYSVRNIKGLFNAKDINYLDIVVTASDDSIFIFSLNRHPKDFIDTYFSFSDTLVYRKSKIYELYSPDYLDKNTAIEKEKIQISEQMIEFNDYYKFPPHSFTIIAVPIKKPTNVSNDISLNFSVVPNPFSDYFVVNYNKNELIKDIRCFNLIGEYFDLPTYELSSEKLLLDSDFLINGLYFIVIRTKDEIISIPAVKF